MKRIIARNADVSRAVVAPQATSEQYSLFRGYVDARHGDGGMADMSVLDFSMMVEDSHVESEIVEYRTGGRRDGALVGCCVTDVLADGLSMVYSFYEPNMPERSLGSYMILDHIARVRSMGLRHLYLGYWVEGSRKMGYKARFTPQERLGMSGWELVV